VNEREVQVETQIPPKAVPESLVLGVYANTIQQLSTESETILDFSIVLPAQYALSAAGKVQDLTVTHQLVARVLISTPKFIEFLRSAVASNSGLLQSQPDTTESSDTNG
jgi:hypothetical protein